MIVRFLREISHKKKDSSNLNNKMGDWVNYSLFNCC